MIAEYLVREALAPQIVGKSCSQLLDLTVCDPAMGSGGFLVAATKFSGDAYYEAQAAEGIVARDDLTPPISASQHGEPYRSIASTVSI